jgi:glycine/D-amino acid oxidase-like deaminating enzyme
MINGISSWRDVKFDSYPIQKGILEVDIAIVGGGITGITAAYFLSKNKSRRVALFEKDKLCSGATGDTTAFITQSLDTEYSKLIELFGRTKAKNMIASHQNAIDIIEKIIKENKINCEFQRCSDYIYSIDKKSAEILKQEEQAAKSLGTKIKFIRDNRLGFMNHGYLEIFNQAKFHPLKYLSALSKIASKNGAKIFEKTKVKAIEGSGPYIIKTPKGDILAHNVFVATYAPFNKKLFFKKAFYTSYIMELELPSSDIPEGIYEDTMNPYHYFRVDKMGKKDRIIVGGEDHREDVPSNEEKNFQALKDYINETFPHIRYKVVRKWAGPIVEPIDGVAFIGPHEEKNIYYATGFSGNGMTYGTIAAEIISEAISKKKLNLIYDPKRIPSIKQLSSKAYDYGEEFIRGAVKNSFKSKKKKRI